MHLFIIYHIAYYQYAYAEALKTIHAAPGKADFMVKQKGKR